MSLTLREGDWVRIEHFGRHKAVVLRVVSASHVLVIYATSSKYPALEPLEVMPDSPEGRPLGLYLPTYFYANNCIPKRTHKVLEHLGRCPPRFYQQLRKLAAPLLADLDHLSSAEIDQLAEQAERRNLGQRS